MKPFNCVVMFPYPSGAGLHLGHYYNYAIIDSYCRWLRRSGREVFQPFGYDAFGLPAENYARSIGGDPRDVTWDNINRFREQMKRMNTEYEERLVTCTPTYTRWTQWLFTKLLEKGLAYKAFGPVNFCPSCDTVLANEQVSGGFCNRCNTKPEIRELNQWYFKITAYKDRLIKNLEWIDYPEGTKKQQAVWLENLRDWCVSRQRKWGCPIPVEGEEDTLDTFVDSSFYFLRYLTKSHKEFLPAEDYQPVDLYVGGPEHACMHLIYARFVHMFLYDIGVVPQEEPFNKVIHQGMITAGGAKMGKSKGNAVSPDDYDPDELRMYLMFLGPYQDGGDWNDKAIAGIHKFLKRMKVWLGKATKDGAALDLGPLQEKINKHLADWKVNKVVSSFMEFYNANKDKIINEIAAWEVERMLRCFAPGFSLQQAGDEL
jgi:leucyl-tRNA synthetase